MWPHELFSLIWRHYPTAWERRMCPSPAKLASFWDSQKNNPQMQHPDLLAKSDLQSRCIPLTIHGDGVGVAGKMRTWQKMLDVWSWSSVLGEGTVLERTMYITSWFHAAVCKADGHNSYDWIARKLKWSFDALFDAET